MLITTSFLERCLWLLLSRAIGARVAYYFPQVWQSVDIRESRISPDRAKVPMRCRPRDLLLVANRDNPIALSDFGYTVDDWPQAQAKPAP